MQVYPSEQVSVEQANNVKVDSDGLNQQTANEVFGKLIKHSRENGEMLLFAGLGDVAKVKLTQNKLTICCTSKDCKTLLDKHKQFVGEFLENSGMLKTFDVEILVDEEKQRQSKLKEIFGDKLKII